MKSLLFFAVAHSFYWPIIWVPFGIGAIVGFLKSSNEPKFSDRIASAFGGGIAGLLIAGVILYIVAMFQGGSVDDM